MSSPWVYSTNVVYADKVNISDPAVPTINKANADTFNDIKGFLDDIRTAIKAGEGHGFTAAAVAPSVTGLDTFLWVSTTNSLLKYRFGGTDKNIPFGATSTKGDMLVYTGSNWQVVPAGTNTHVLTADSAQTAGVKWAAAASGSSTLAATYTAGVSQASSTLDINATALGVIIKDAASPVAGSLFDIRNNGSTVKYLDITSAGTQAIKSGYADGAAAIAASIDTTATWSNATAKLLSVRNNTTERFTVYASGDYNASSHGFYYDFANQRLQLGVPSTNVGRLSIQGTNGSTSQMIIANSTGPVQCLLGAADSPSGAFIGSATNHPLYLRQTNNNIIAMSATDFSPVANNTVDLGLTGVRWKNFWVAGTSTLGAVVFEVGATASGGSSFNLSGSTGTFLTSTGANTLSGDVTISGSKTFTTGTGAVAMNGDMTVASGKSITSAAASDLQLNAVTGRDVRLRVNGTNVVSVGGTLVAVNQDLSMAPNMDISVSGAGTSLFDFSNGSGIFRTTTGAATFVGSSNMFTNGLTSAGDIIPDTDNTQWLGHLDKRWVLIGSTITGYGPGVGNNINNADGKINLNNPTAATVGAQKYSPALLFSGNGWKTDATAGSQSTEILAQLVPVQGTANPTVGLSFQSNVNGAGWVERLNIGNTAILASVPITANLGATVVAPTWTAITYSNTWVDYGASATSRYTKDATGQVTLEIRCKNGSSPTAAVNSGTPIAAGYRPSQVTQIVGHTLAGGIALGDLGTDGIFTPSVSSTSGIFFRATYFAEN